MIDVRLYFERAEQAHAANAQHHLLHDARLAVAAVEVARHEAISLFILRNVGIEQVKRDAPDARAPSLRAHGAPAHLDLDYQRSARFVRHTPDRKLRRMRLAVVLLLPAVAPEPLTEIAVTIEQADGDERQAKIARALQVIACEHAEAARIQGERIVYAVLGAKICDRVLWSNLSVTIGRPGARVSHVRIKVGGQTLHALAIDRVGRHLHDAIPGGLRQQATRVMLALFPDGRV